MVIEDFSLGAGNVLFWLSDNAYDLTAPRLWLDRPWTTADGTSKTVLSLADILEAVAAYRHIQRSLGVQSGDVVVARLGTPIDVYLHWIALAADGAIYAPVNPNFSDDLLRAYGRGIDAVGELTECSDGGAKLSSRWEYFCLEEERQVPVVTFDRPVFVCEAEHKHDPDDVVLLCHTSGTTGHPKAVSCTHHGFMAGIRSQMREPKSPLFGSRMLNALPVAHHSWFMTVTWALLSGTSLVLAGDQGAQTLVRDVETFRPDSIRSFSCTLREVARLGLAPGSLRSVGLWMTTGDVSRRSDIEAVSALGSHPVGKSSGSSRAPGMFVLDGFGSTELGHLHFSILHAPGTTREARCIGRPASFASAAILDEKGRELGDGEIGYLAVSSDAVTPGYWNDPERTANSRLGNFWITGDVGYRDAFGRYFHLDRYSDVIETPDGKVYSVRCEEELMRCIPQIERCAVVQREQRGDVAPRVVCLVETEDRDRDADSWHRAVNDVLDNARLDRVAETVVLAPGALPLGPTGKIRKFLARGEEFIPAESGPTQSVIHSR